MSPGFVDVHTHYDGQVSWDDTLEPSSLHGVTTVVSGNCGVGFAPVRPGREQCLIELMEGVEDIAGSALAEGITWQWESFPEYLDAVEKRSLAVDYGTQIAHGAVRGYAMGERGARNEEATPDDIAAMARIVQEAVEAGALGFSTSRTEAHRAIDGEPVPGTYAAEAELFGLGRAMAAGGRAVFEVSPQGTAGESPAEATMREMDWMTQLGAEIERPVTFTMIQTGGAPDLWRRQLERAGKALENGVELYAQFAARPFGMLFGFPGYHAFTHRPTYRRLKAELGHEELAARLADPGVRETILSEADLPPQPVPLFDGLYALIQHSADRIFAIGDPPDYEPTPDQLKATADVKRDMEKSQPMDRLVCGDVGFGKTEVAIRAIFKAITAGRQVAMLAPTTVLAQQHWRTLSERFAPYPIKVALLNRFRTTSERKAILEGLKNGTIDAVVGTHQLLSKSTVFDKLGLLVVDE